MYMNINVSTQERFIKQAQSKMLTLKYWRHKTLLIAGSTIACLVFVLLTQVFDVEKISAMPLSVYVPIALFNIFIFYKRKTIGNKLPSYEVNLKSNEIVLKNLYDNNFEPNQSFKPIKLDVDQIQRVYKIESGYVLYLESDKLDDLIKVDLAPLTLIDSKEGYFAIFIPRLSFETYYLLKRFNQWMLQNNIVLAS